VNNFPILYLWNKEIFLWSFFVILFGIKELNKICKKTLKIIIHQVSCFVEYLCIVQWTFYSLFVDVCLLFCVNNKTAKPILRGPTFCDRSHKPIKVIKFFRILTVKNCLLKTTLPPPPPPLNPSLIIEQSAKLLVLQKERN